MSRTVFSLDLADIRYGPGPYTMSFGFDPDPLARSVRQSGIINPPCVSRNGEGAWEIVAGYRRVGAARSLGHETIEVMDITRSVPSPSERLLLNLQENLATRAFNDVEKGMALSRLTRHLPRSAVLEAHMPLLGLPSHEPTLAVYLGLEELEQDIRCALAGGGISLRTAEAFLEMDPPSRMAVLTCLKKLKLNSNYQKQLLEILVDISTKKNVSIPDLLAEEELVQVAGDLDLNAPQKTRRLFSTLRRRRSPRIAAAEERFQRIVSRLTLPDGVHVKAPAHFEGAEYRLEILFRDGNGLRRTIQSLCETPGLESIADPWLKRS